MAASPDARAAKMMSRQYGLITFAQALACDLTPREIECRVNSGRWVRLHHGVFVVAGAERTWRQTVLAACFAAGEAGVASHRTAGVLRNLIERRPATPDVTVPFGKHPRSEGYAIHRSRIPFEPEYIGPIPVTSAARTVIDLAGVVDRDPLEEALDLAIRRHGVSAVELLGRINGLTGLKGLGVLRRLLVVRAARDGQNDGVFATRFARLLEHGGLPAPEIEYTINDAHGRFVARADLCYPRERLVIELDDWGTHSTPKALERDTKRQNDILELGFTIRRFTWNDLDRPAYVTGVVRRALIQLGHPAVSL